MAVILSGDSAAASGSLSENLNCDNSNTRCLKAVPSCGAVCLSVPQKLTEIWKF